MKKDLKNIEKLDQLIIEDPLRDKDGKVVKDKDGNEIPDKGIHHLPNTLSGRYSNILSLDSELKTLENKYRETLETTEWVLKQTGMHVGSDSTIFRELEYKSRLWIYDTYEFLRVLKNIFESEKIKKLEKTIAQIRMPLAKYEKKSKGRDKKRLLKFHMIGMWDRNKDTLFFTNHRPDIALSKKDIHENTPRMDSGLKFSKSAIIFPRTDFADRMIKELENLEESISIKANSQQTKNCFIFCINKYFKHIKSTAFSFFNK